MTNKPTVQRIKKEKRNLEVAPPPAGVSRRFFTFLGTGSAALVAGSAGILGCSNGSQGASQNGSDEAGGQQAQSSAGSQGGGGTFFKPVEASDADELRLPEGFKYEIVRSSGDSMGSGMVYGDHNDYVAYFPINMLDGGDNSDDGILFVNHEYVNPMFWSDYTDPESAIKKTKEQIAREKSGVGGSVVRVKKEVDAWRFVEGDELNRRIDATTPMAVTGPAAGSPEMKMEGKEEVIGSVGTNLSRLYMDGVRGLAEDLGAPKGKRTGSR